MNKVILQGREISYDIVRKKIKHSYLRVKGNHLFITSNRHATNADLLLFIQRNEHKILRLLDQLKNKKLYSNEFLELYGNTVPMKTLQSRKNTLSYDGEEINLIYTSEEKIPSIIEKFYAKSLIDEANAYLELISENVKDLLPKDGVIFKTQLMKSQFGSCHSSKRVVKLNTFLARLDKRFMHAIICHELVHFKMKGHQKDFYTRLDVLFPNYKQTNQELRKIYRNYEV